MEGVATVSTEEDQRDGVKGYLGPIFQTPTLPVGQTIPDMSSTDSEVLGDGELGSKIGKDIPFDKGKILTETKRINTMAGTTERVYSDRAKK